MDSRGKLVATHSDLRQASAVRSFDQLDRQVSVSQQPQITVAWLTLSTSLAPPSPIPFPHYGLLAGILGNSSIVLLYLATRTLGVPLFGPEAGEVEAVGALDACATVSEVLLVGVLGVLLFWRLLHERVGLVLLVAAMALLTLAHLPHLILLFRLP